ncbi:3'-5' exonuclease [Aureivirga sp. CE67]|uniref:3'-5' exonuclease n=1 Tax=Aureivirga sp. CE67 TaxID=1788983 RepID=UPI0018C995B5|nr:3'-5' exonuclease [Aureivirga sp. CE67]
MKYIVFDLEATCWEKANGRKHEVIEIGAVMVNEEKEIVSEFVQFVRPGNQPILSDFCTELTSITQKDVENAPFFTEAIENFKKWIGTETEDYVLCSWGFFDRNQLEAESKQKGLNYDWVQKHISIKHQYTDVSSAKRHMGMKGALAREKFSLEGTHHRGIDDARNITKIFLKYFDQWSITEKTV